MRQVGLGITDTLKYSKFFALPEGQQWRERGMQADVVGQRDDVVARNRELWAQRIVGCVRIGDNGVQPVVATLELHEHDQVAVIWASRHRCPRDIGGEASRQSEQRRRRGQLEKVSAVHGYAPVYLSWYATSSTMPRTIANGSLRGSGGACGAVASNSFIAASVRCAASGTTPNCANQAALSN